MHNKNKPQVVFEKEKSLLFACAVKFNVHTHTKILAEISQKDYIQKKYQSVLGKQAGKIFKLDHSLKRKNNPLFQLNYFVQKNITTSL